MARSATSFFCQACGHESLTWSGRCAGCGEWNTLVEAPRPEAAEAGHAQARAGGGAPAGKPVGAARCLGAAVCRG